MSIATREWTISLFSKLANLGAFFSVDKLKCNVKTVNLYTSDTSVDPEGEALTTGVVYDKLLAIIPHESAGGIVDFSIYRNNISFSGSGAPRADIIVNDTVVVSDFELIYGQTERFTFKVSKDDKIILKYKEIRDAAKITRYIIRVDYTGDYFIYN